MKGADASIFWRSASQYFFGGMDLPLLMFACLRLGVDLATMGFVYLMLIPPPMAGSIVGVAVLSIVVVACLNYFCLGSARTCDNRRPS
jgi:hypothetical protein